jgi:predicted nucleic acid-binding protein
MKRVPAVLFVAEPPAQYLVLPPLVVDCSVLSSAVFEEESRDDALNLLKGKTLHAPYLLEHELVSVALKKQKLGLTSEAAASALSSQSQLNIALHRTDIEAQHALAVQYKLSAYDAAYLWLAAELKAPLATFDDKLAKAASTHLSSLS